MAIIRPDYSERVYAGVLGKIIGVYLGRPFEGWDHARIINELGEIKYYVHEKLNKPLIVVDDDISGTFAFLRAMPDYGNTIDLTAAQIGQTWLNYLVEEKTILWWGGMGNSTEHTAYLRLKAGIPAPESGSMALNGQVVAEQIGAQIFIDGWGMISPGDPEKAAELARRAGSVSHDGEAIYGAQVVAAMEAHAFVESSMDKLLDTAVGLIPADSTINRLIGDVREWHAKYSSWYDCFYRIAANYGYDKFGGNCHMVPNHAVMIMSWLYGQDDFAEAMKIVNTAGWDTDCNSGNVGCLMGIKDGLAGLEVGPDYRTPVGDRMLVPTAEGGRTVTDAVTEAYEVINIGRALAGEEQAAPKDGSKYHFEMPGSVQGWQPEASIACEGTTTVENVVGHSEYGTRSLAIRYRGLADGRICRVERETFPAIARSGGYGVLASPTLNSGQTVTARLSADEGNSGPVAVRLYVKTLGAGDEPDVYTSAPQTLDPSGEATFSWRVDVRTGCPIAMVGVQAESQARAEGTLYLDWLTWDGATTLKLDPPKHDPARWLSSWVAGCDGLTSGRGEHLRLIQNTGAGAAIYGTRDWRDYTVSATIRPHMCQSFGLATRVQGLKRGYALRLVQGNKAQLLREQGDIEVLAEADLPWAYYRDYRLTLTVQGERIQATIDGETLFDVEDQSLLTGGGIALFVEEGRIGASDVEVSAL